MKPVRQTIFDGKRGDCFRACVASALELPLEVVPNFCEHEDWWDRLQKWLSERGLAFMELGCVDGALPPIPPLPDGSLCIAAGMGPRGVRHAVVCRHRVDSTAKQHWLELEFDPHPSDLGVSQFDEVGWFLAMEPSNHLKGTK